VCATGLHDIGDIETELVEEPEMLQTRLMIENGSAPCHLP